MEVSSHALELRRADAIHWAAAVFTNLTQDHLDFHPTMEDYFQAKRRLFAADPRVRIANVDDPYGRRLAAEFPGTVTVRHRRRGRRAARRPTCRPSSPAPRSVARTAVALRAPLPGALQRRATRSCAVAAARALGVDDDDDRRARCRGAGAAPGRFEPVDEGQDFAVLVDYAHTPDSLENVLRAARDVARGRVLAVFGCGGDRDRGKRPLMGEIAARIADVAIVTSDNPRSEDPEAIIGEILAGIPPAPAAAVETIEDRRAAIERAIALARRVTSS